MLLSLIPRLPFPPLSSFTGPTLGSWLNLYKTLDRVLFIDASCNHHNVGLGSLVGDYQSWFTWGLLSHRAVFIKYNDCGDTAKGTCNAFDDEGASAGVGDPACGRVDLGKFFTGPGVRRNRYLARFDPPDSRSVVRRLRSWSAGLPVAQVSTARPQLCSGCRDLKLVLC